MASLHALAALAVAPLASAQVCPPQPLADPEGASPEWFGASVAIDGDRALVGAPQNGVVGRGVGKVLDVRRDPATGIWQIRKTFFPTTVRRQTYFGRSIALDGELAVVGAPGTTASQPNYHGRAYVYVEEVGGWRLAQTLYAPEGSGRFGAAVHLEGDRLLVADPFAVRGGQPRAGAVHVYSWNDSLGRFDRRQELVRPRPVREARFGSYMVVADGEIWVGLPSADLGALDRVGAVEVYGPTARGYEYRTTIRSPDPGAQDAFGVLARVGEEVWVGEMGDSGSTPRGGAVHVLRRDPAGGDWIFAQRLEPIERTGDSYFGSRIAGRDGLAFVRGWLRRTSTSVGYLDVFARSAEDDDWSRVDRIVSTDVQDSSTDWGSGLAFDGRTLLVGSPMTVESVIPQGRAYFFDTVRCSPVGTRLCAPNTATSAGTPAHLGAWGSDDLADDDLLLRVAGLPPATVGAMIVGPTAAVSVLPATYGFLCVGGAIERFGGAYHSSAVGVAVVRVPLGGVGSFAPFPGSSWVFQSIFRDRVGADVAGLSSAVLVTFD